MEGNEDEVSHVRAAHEYDRAFDSSKSGATLAMPDQPKNRPSGREDPHAIPLRVSRRCLTGALLCIS